MSTTLSFVQWNEFLELGKDIENSVIEDILKSQKPEECAVMVYTVRWTAPNYQPKRFLHLLLPSSLAPPDLLKVSC